MSQLLPISLIKTETRLDKAPWVWCFLLTYSQIGVECCHWGSLLSKRHQLILLKRAQGVHKVHEVTHPWTQWSFSKLGYSYTGRLNKCLLTRGCLVWEGPALCHHLTTVHHLNRCLCQVILKGIRDEIEQVPLVSKFNCFWLFHFPYLL